MLQLSHVADCYVGGVGATVRGVTRGQRKRLGIAIEIINLPEIIFLDGKTFSSSCLILLPFQNRQLAWMRFLPMM
jgi:hypothetical protein